MDQPVKHAGGRPPHEPTGTTRRQVEMMAAFGNTEDEISAIMSMSKPTLRKHYATELSLGHLKANNAVTSNLFRQATKDDPRAFHAIKFWLNCRAGWSEYAPPPVPRPEPLGKKEIAQLDAETADQGTTWGDVLQKPGELPN